MDVSKRTVAIVIFFMATLLPIYAHAAHKAAYKDMSCDPWFDIHNVEVSIGVGPTYYRVNKGHIQVSPYERDSSIPSSVNQNAIYRIGAGYYFFKSYFNANTFFNSFLAELNLYHSNVNIEGYVLQSGQLDLNNYYFHAPFSSTSLILDFKPGFLAYQKLSPYAIIGFGVAWNQINYRERIANDDVPADSFISLASRTKQDFTYDLGLGARYAFTQHISGSLEYIYNHLGNATPNSASGDSTSRANIQIPPTFTLYNQSLFFNVIYNF